MAASVTPPTAADRDAMLERLRQQLFVYGDALQPLPECAQLVLRTLMKWQRADVAAAVRACKKPPKQPNKQLEALLDAHPEVRSQFDAVENAEKLQQRVDDAAEQDDEEVDDWRGSSSGGGPSGSNNSADARRIERMRFADERTAAMSAADYEVFAKARGNLGRGEKAKAFVALTTSNVLADMALTGTGKAQKRVFKLLTKLWADKMAEIVDDANRDAHGGELKVPDKPIALAHYEVACEKVMPSGGGMKRPREE